MYHGSSEFTELVLHERLRFTVQTMKAIRSSSQSAFVAIMLLGWHGAAIANGAISISPAVGSSNTPNIGKVVEASPVTTATFRVDPSTGSVTETGSLVRLTSGSATTPSYTIVCTNGSGSGAQCGHNNQTVLINFTGPGDTGSAAITAFNLSVTPVTPATCGAVSQPNTTSASVTCTVPTFGSVGQSENIATVKVGVDIKVYSVTSTGNQSPAYTLNAN